MLSSFLLAVFRDSLPIRYVRQLDDNDLKTSGFGAPDERGYERSPRKSVTLSRKRIRRREEVDGGTDDWWIDDEVLCPWMMYRMRSKPDYIHDSR